MTDPGHGLHHIPLTNNKILNYHSVKNTLHYLECKNASPLLAA